MTIISEEIISAWLAYYTPVSCLVLMRNSKEYNRKIFTRKWDKNVTKRTAVSHVPLSHPFVIK